MKYIANIAIIQIFQILQSLKIYQMLQCDLNRRRTWATERAEGGWAELQSSITLSSKELLRCAIVLLLKRTIAQLLCLQDIILHWS